MNKLVSMLALAALVTLPSLAHADEPSNQNGSKQNPASSAAATPDDHKHSAGTVGAMKDAEGGSFTASKADQKKDMLKTK